MVEIVDSKDDSNQKNNPENANLRIRLSISATRKSSNNYKQWSERSLDRLGKEGSRGTGPEKVKEGGVQEQTEDQDIFKEIEKFLK